MSAETIAIIDALAIAGETAAIRIVCKVLGERNATEAAKVAVQDEQRRAVQRAPAAERQRRRRNKRRCQVTPDIFGQDDQKFIDAAIVIESESHAESRRQEIPPTPPKEDSTSLHSVESFSKKERAKLCPEDFRPKDQHYELAQARGYDRAKVDDCAREMGYWSRSNSHRKEARKADWDECLMGWIMRQKPVLSVVQGGRPVIKPQREMTPEEFEREMQIASERGKAHRKILFGG
jgi:hypothetical protein